MKSTGDGSRMAEKTSMESLVFGSELPRGEGLANLVLLTGRR